MDKEQAKQLKTDDKILIEVRFKKIDKDGDAVIEYTNSISDCENGFISPKNIVGVISETQLNKPKYDPCRTFRKGDKVEYYPRNGRDFFDMPWVYDAAVVMEDEHRSGTVVVRFTFNYGEPSVHKVPWYHLHLVTPVEELEPYSVGESTDYFSVENDDKEICLYWKDSHPNAKEAAEAECARLNAEYRKGQNNGMGH